MEWYHQLIEQLAEWFMQLFFDPAYHLVSEEKPHNIIVRKKQEVSDWWVKQKIAIQKLATASKPEFSDNIMFNKLKRWMNIDVVISPLAFFLGQRWVQSIS